MRVVNVGMLGLGTVGTGVARLLVENSSIIEEKLGARLVLKRIAVRDTKKVRDIGDGGWEITSDIDSILADPGISIIVELIGGYSPAREYVLAAINNGKNVVTANKALLAFHGDEIYAAAERAQVEVRYEAAVAGGIPVLSAIKGNMCANRFWTVLGILNGTCNYILTRMTREGADFAAALKKAQELGYAEADPPFDIEGIDTAHKLCLLVSLCFGTRIDFKEIHTEGISSVSSLDIDYAARCGYRIKLLAIGKRSGDLVEARVQPAMVPMDDPLAAIDGVYNAVRVTGDYAGTVMFSGRGAGMAPTASAVVGDLVAVARNILTGRGRRIAPLGFLDGKIATLPVKPVGDTISKYYLRFSVADRPGILARIAGALGSNQVSVRSAIQTSKRVGEAVPVVIVTHEAMEKDVRKAIDMVESLGITSQRVVMLRIEDDLA